MGNPAPFQARSRLRGSAASTLRRSGAISVSQCSRPRSGSGSGSASLHQSQSQSHVNCPCCNSTLDLHHHLPSNSRYAPYALSARRAFHRRRRHQASSSSAPNDSNHQDDNHSQSQSYSQSESESDSGSHSDSDLDPDDLDAIPFPYSSPTSTAAYSSPARFSFTNQSPPPIPRLPSSSELEHLYQHLPTTFRPPFTARPPNFVTNNNNNNNNHNFNDTADSDPEPWMYGTLPRRSTVTLPVTPLRSSMSMSMSMDALDRDQSTQTQLISPSSGVTAASSSSASSTTSASMSSHTSSPASSVPTPGGSLVGNVLRGVYSSLTSLLGSSASTLVSSSAADPPSSASTSPFPSRDPNTDDELLPSTTTRATAADPSPAELASTSVSSTRPITRPRPRPGHQPNPSGSGSRRPTGLALAPALSARSRGTLASAAAQAHADRHDPWYVPGESTIRAMATGGYGPGHPAATDTQSPPGISAGYLQTLGAYAHSGITANLHGGGGGGGGGRGGRLVFPPTPRAFYATLGSASTPATSTTVNVDIDDTLALARHALADPSSSSWGYPRDERVLTNAVHTILDLDLDVNTNASSPDSDHVNMQPPDLGWRTSHGESSQMALESARLRERVLSARALSLHGSQFAHDGADDVGVGGPSAGEVSEEYDVLDDHEQETYIPEYLLRNAASASASASGRVGEGQGLDDEDGDGDELGPMDDSWEMVVRPFDSVRGPATPYDYHDHMF